MSTVEAAASLFGSSDSGSDFFTAPEGGNSAAESPSFPTKDEELFSAQDPASLFGNASNNEASLQFPAYRDTAAAEDGALNTSHLDPPTSDPLSSQDSQIYEHSHDTQTTYDDTGGYSGYEGQGWYDDQGQWQWYEPGQQSGHDDTYLPATSTPYTNHSTDYSGMSYVPPVGPSTLTPYGTTPSTLASQVGMSQKINEPFNSVGHTAQNQGTFIDGAAVSSYDPYKPIQNNSNQHNLDTQSHATTYAPHYDPYHPPVAQSRSLPAVRPAATNTLAPSSVPNAPTLVEQLKAPAAPYRPSSLNAYDPPLPAAKPKRSTVATAYRQNNAVATNSFLVSPPPSIPPPLRSATLSPLGFGPGAARSGAPPPPPRSPVFSLREIPHAPAVAASMDNSRSTHDQLYLSDQQKPANHIAHDDSFVPGAHYVPNDRLSLSPPLRQNTISPQKQLSTHSSNTAIGRPNASDHWSNGSPERVEDSRSTQYQDLDGSTFLAGGRKVHNESWDDGYSNGDTFGSHVQGDAFVDPESGSGSSGPLSSSGPERSLRDSVGQFENRKRMSPGLQWGSSSQRSVSPGSESGSLTRSSGRSASPSSRIATTSASHMFTSLDGQLARQGESYAPASRALERVSSPSRHYIGSGGGYTVPHSSQTVASYANHNPNVVDLGSDTSVYRRSTSPEFHHQGTADNVPSVTPSTYDPYKPRQPPLFNRTASPVSSLVPRPSDTYATPQSNAPRRNSHDLPPTRDRSMSNISSYSASSMPLYDPYASVQFATRSEHTATVEYPNYRAQSGQHGVDSFARINGPGRTSMEVSHSNPHVSGPYAPSPSLLGTNDPLGRAGAKVPVISFGFGGKLVSCFHSSPATDSGFDVALYSRKCTDVHIRYLHKIIPESALGESTTVYPGPLFGDPGTPVTALVRTTTSSSAKNKTKKTKVLAYLKERAAEIEGGLGYLGSDDRRRAEGKLVLVGLLHTLVEHDGQLYGSTESETAVRAAVLPRLGNTQDVAGSNVPLNAPTGAALASGTFGLASTNEPPLAEYVVRPSTLNTIQDFLLRGEKRKAYHYALDEKLWSHAMVISSSIDKDAFREVVNEFIRAELSIAGGPRLDQIGIQHQGPVTNGRESLRLAYSLYSGQSSAAVSQLFPTKSILQNGPNLTLQPPTPMAHPTPISPNFPSPSLTSNVPPEALSHWQEYAIMLFSGQMATESSAALTTLGDYLLSNNWTEAAHCCYLLSPQSSLIGGVGTPSARVVLVGSQNPQHNPVFHKDTDSLVFSEITEFALSLHTPAKGQEAFVGFPHLQAYRLVHALQLAELGQTVLAKRYCEAISSASFRPSPYLSQLFNEQLKELTNRLNGETEIDKANSWIGGKIAKPSLDSIGDWLGGTLSKFVAGETEPALPPTAKNSMPNNPAFSGTFSQYSNISSANTSKSPSPAPSIVNIGTMSNGLPKRADSASGIRVLSNSYSPVNRASSAMDYSRPGSGVNTPPPRIASADAATTTFAQSQSFSQAMGSYGYDNGTSQLTNGSAEHSKHEEQPQQETGWWSAAYGDSNGVTPTATTFLKVENSITESESGSGFISLMDDYAMTPSPSLTPSFSGMRRTDEEDIDDDLGLGNASRNRTPEVAGKSTDERTETPKEEPKKPDIRPNPSASSSGSWLGRLFSRSASTTPGPVKANLGETESTFYYDKDLKKWVNKKAGAETSKLAAPPPPPSRAQTASPSRSLPNMPNAPPSPMFAPPRPSSAAEPSMAPPKKSVPRIRSSLIPEEASSAPSTPVVMSSLVAPPPTGIRPKSAATKRNVRSRYVDVFQENS